ncbi:MAG: hypothetical protein ACOY71_10955 [Gemmatimonadota bacterium]
MISSFRPALRIVACAVVPEAEHLSQADWAEVERIVDDALALRPPRMRRQLALFFRLLDLLALAWRGRPVGRLAPAEATRLLERLERAPLLLLRRGVWGLRTLVLMGYYGRPAAGEAIGYRASARGWEAVR